MNILFLTLYHIDSLHSHGIYEDLLREFSKCDHNIYVVSPVERRYHCDTTLHIEGNARILELKTGNIQKTGIIEKGVSTLLIEQQFIAAIKQYFSEVVFDLVLYSTPPITLAGVIKFVKKRDSAKTYLLLKDIFPQNAVDIGLMSSFGMKGILYNWFRSKEKKLYAISDYIGCMSPANVEYLLKHNQQVNPETVSVCPNCIDPMDLTLPDEEKQKMRLRYGIPLDKRVFVYGGNLGKPQGIPFLIDCLHSQRDNQEIFFLIVGDGTEYKKVQEYVELGKQPNLKLMSRLPKEEYDKMIGACDIGMIFLDHRFTIPNFPSRLLAYMQAGLPVLAVTDPNTDIGKVIIEGEFGWWCESNDVSQFSSLVCEIAGADIQRYGHNARQYLTRFYSVQNIYRDSFEPVLERIRNEKHGQKNPDHQS